MANTAMAQLTRRVLPTRLVATTVGAMMRRGEGRDAARGEGRGTARGRRRGEARSQGR
jgi:hypothetical protein